MSNGGRLPLRGDSPLVVPDRVYFFNREGATTIVDAKSTSSAELGHNQLDAGQIATPGIVDGELIAHTETHL